MKISQYDLILGRIISEKTGEGLTSQVFKVTKDATKQSVKNAISKIYSVEVKSVNILNVKGKIKRFKGVLGKRSSYKKAYVTLQDNHKFNL